MSKRKLKGVSLPNAGGSSYSVGVRNYGGVEPVVLKQEPAFNPGLPLRPNPPRKRDSVNRRIPPPKLGNPIDGSANGRARGQDLKLRGQPQVQPQERAEKVKNNQASVSVELSTSSARPTSTTRPPSTVTATSSQISTSMAKNMNNRTRSKNWNNSSSTERLFNTTTATPLHSEFNVVETEQVRYYPEGRTSPVAFNATLPDLVTVDASRTSRIPTGTSGYAEIEPKLNINVSSFSTALDSAAGGFNDTYLNSLQSIFNRITVDIKKSAKSGLYSDWTLNNFNNYLVIICRAIENIVALESILAYRAIQSEPLLANRSLSDYQVPFSSTAILARRDELISLLKVMWFPPTFSQLILWFYQNYRLGELTTSPCYRFVPNENFIYTNAGVLRGDLAAQLASCCNDIKNNSYMSSISALLSNVYPSGVIRSIPAPFRDVVYDDRHLEVYINDSVMFTNRGANNVSSCFPIDNGSTPSNEIPYYMNRNPQYNDDNGLAFALQAQRIKLSNAATDYQIGPKFNGIRLNGIVNIDAAHSAEAGSSTNKFYFVPKSPANNNATCIPRVNHWSWAYGGMDAHTVVYISGANSGFLSRINTSFQRVFFNLAETPRMNQTRLLDVLFSLIPAK